MSSQPHIIRGIEIYLERKPVKHFNFTVYPRQKRVRLSVPLLADEQDILAAVDAKISWLQTSLDTCVAEESRPPATRSFLPGQQLFLLGEPHDISVQSSSGISGITVTGKNSLCITSHVGADEDSIKGIVREWYRKEFKQRLPYLLDPWSRILPAELTECRIRLMKTRWGSCNIRKRRIWLNLQLAMMSPPCIEYVIVHEIVHLLERQHNRRFYQLMDRYLDDWRDRRHRLHEESIQFGTTRLL